MPLRVLIAPDKFKGTLTAAQAARAMAAGWRKGRSKDSITQMPISDGGDGFGALLGRHLAAEACEVETVDAARRPLRTAWWWHSPSRTAIVESASIIGLAMLPQGRFHPFDLDTYGLGQVLRAVARKRPQTCLVGIGGSATNDAGFGAARALGWEFLDGDGDRIMAWPELVRLQRIRAPRHVALFKELIVAVDVWNRLLGKHGATRVYGPQKGVRPEDIPLAERGFKQLVKVLDRELPFPCQPSRVAGSGAAGGLGFGLLCFAGARLEPGFDIFARHTGFEERVRMADLVLTGEGAIDRTTVEMGKGVGQVARSCRRTKTPCLGLAGIVQDAPKVTAAFTATYALAPTLTSPQEAMAKPAVWLRRLAEQAAREWSEG
jgi:glycerate kinase